MEESPQTPPVEESLKETPEAPAEDAPTYMVADWAGMPQYVCIACSHATFVLDHMQDHQARMHAGVMCELVVERSPDTATSGPLGATPAPEEPAPEATGEDAETPAASPASQEGTPA